MARSVRPDGLRLTVLIAALSLFTAEGVAAKCNPVLEVPGLERGAPVVVWDGSIVAVGLRQGQPVLDDMDPDDVLSVKILCWNPRTGTFGGSPAIPVIAYWTKASLHSTRTPLEQLLGAQAAHFAAHVRYATSLDALIDFGGPRDASLEFSATSDGWSAATPPGHTAHRCAVYSGSAAQALAGMTEREVTCEQDETKANRALKEWYEAL